MRSEVTFLLTPIVGVVFYRCETKSRHHTAMPKRSLKIMGSVAVTPTEGTFTGVARKRIFNLETMEKETKEVPYSGTLYKDTSELSNLDSDTLLKLVNIGAKRQALLEAKASIQGASAKIVNSFVNQFRMFPAFASVADRKEQTSKIMAYINSQQFLIEQLK